MVIGLLFIVSTLTSLASGKSLSSVVLSTHNYLRFRHHAPPLVWDQKLAAYARKQAAACVFKHSGGPYGENLAAGYSSITAAVNAWYAENEHYSYWYPHFSDKTGHFTQLVWVSTRKVGCALVTCDGKNGTPGQFLVCEYDPPGNVTNAGYFKQNVLSS